MNEVDSLPKPQNQPVEEAAVNDSPALVVEINDSSTQSSVQSVEESNKQNKDDKVSDHPESVSEESVAKVAEEKPEEKLTSPPRKSARLSALRRDSTTDSEVSITAKPESPVSRRRSLRRLSTSSQDTPPPKARDENSVKKLPTIEEVDSHNKSIKKKAESESQHNEKELVDELAAAFVEEFIDDE